MNISKASQAHGIVFLCIQTILKITPFSNTTAEPDETTTFSAITDEDIDLNELIEKAQQNNSSPQGFTFYFSVLCFFLWIHFS